MFAILSIYNVCYSKHCICKQNGGGEIMSYNVREMLDSFVGGLGELSKTNPEQVNAFMGLLGAAYEPNALDIKTKELISVGVGCYNRCEYCIVYHSYKAFEAGATKEEIMEAAMVAVAFGGGPSMAYSVTLLRECIAEFEGDF
jgi:AhpD family alkylhydroperoxidase